MKIRRNVKVITWKINVGGAVLLVQNTWFLFYRCNSRCVTADQNGDAQTKTAWGSSTGSSSAETDHDLGKRPQKP